MRASFAPPEAVMKGLLLLKVSRRLSWAIIRLEGRGVGPVVSYETVAAAISARTSSMSSSLMLLMSCSSPAAFMAPGWEKTRIPSRKAIRAGMEVMRAAAESPGSASVSIFAKTMSAWISDILLKVGGEHPAGPTPGCPEVHQHDVFAADGVVENLFPNIDSCHDRA